MGHGRLDVAEQAAQRDLVRTAFRLWAWMRFERPLTGGARCGQFSPIAKTVWYPAHPTYTITPAATATPTIAKNT